jgi:hypothetical protein
MVVVQKSELDEIIDGLSSDVGRCVVAVAFCSDRVLTNLSVRCRLREVSVATGTELDRQKVVLDDTLKAVDGAHAGLERANAREKRLIRG